MNDKEIARLLESATQNSTVFQALEKSIAILGNEDRASVSVSGGSDSDIIVDMCSRVNDNLHYVWFDTGMEYQATKNHLDYLEERYGIKIERVRAKEPVPLAVRHYGLPFLSKLVSTYTGRLQKHNFLFEDKPFEELLAEYPKCKSALKWWCNLWGDKSSFNISRWKYLKEFMIENPPNFPISDGCCWGAKKSTAHEWEKENRMEINIQGVRKAEGGGRTAIKSCFTEKNGEYATSTFRPIFWFKEADKAFYENTYDIRHSECYWRYGLKRTGCVGCPFGRNWQFELEVVKNYEPKLYKLCNVVFGQSYDYTLRYLEYRKKKEEEAKGGYHQYNLFEKEGD